jgi:hypothetical protein
LGRLKQRCKCNKESSNDKKNGNENGSEWRSGFNSDAYTDNGNDDDSVWQGGCNNDVVTKNHDMVTVENHFSNREEWPESSSLFFQREHLNAGDGKKGLVQTAVTGEFQTKTIIRAVAAAPLHMNDDHTNFHLHETNTFKGASCSQREDICASRKKIIHTERKGQEEYNRAKGEATERAFKRACVEENIYPEGDTRIEEFWTRMSSYVEQDMHGYQREKDLKGELHFTMDEPTIRREYLEGTHSVLNNLPMPNVLPMPNENAKAREGFAYVPLVQNVNHLLALSKDVLVRRAGRESDWKDDDGQFICGLLKDIHVDLQRRMQDETDDVSEETRVVTISVFSDGFQANAIVTNNDHNNIQIFSVTLITFKGKSTKRRHTLPFALCFKQKSHEAIVVKLLKEVHALRKVKMRYFGKDKAFHPTVVYLQLVSNDYIERVANTGIAQIGNYTHRWGYSCKYDSEETKSCECCLKRNICAFFEKDFDERVCECSGCADWWDDKHVKTPERYPLQPGQKSESESEPEGRMCVEQTFPMLRHSMKQLEEWWKSKRGELNKTALRQVAEEFLQKVGVAGSVKDGILKDMLDNNVHPTESQSIPETWTVAIATNTLLKQFPSMPMHLMMLGVEKSLFTKTPLIVQKRYKAERKFWEIFTAGMRNVQFFLNSLSLEWCKTMSFTGDVSKNEIKTTGWQSTHYVAWVRTSLFQLAPLEFNPPSDKSKDGVLDAFKLVRTIWFSLVSHIFTDEKVEIEKIEYLVKLFLSSCDSLLAVVGDMGSENDEEEEKDVGRIDHDGVKKKTMKTR